MRLFANSMLGPGWSRRVRYALAMVGIVVASVSCAEGFAPRGDDDDEKFEEGAVVVPSLTAVPSRPTATPQPTVTPRPTATPQPTATPAPTPTPTPTPMLLPELAQDPLRAVIGEATQEIVATDPDGTITELRVLDGPPGLSVIGTDSLRYEPTDAGTYVARVRVTDSQGLIVLGDITLLARHRGHPQALVALGDSVASGHGLDIEDFFGGDPCWRAPNSYPRRVFTLLRDNGQVFPADQAEFALLACSGYDVDDLYEREVTGGFSDIAPASGRRSQLEWAVWSNPRFVTLTIGANDTGFVGPDRLFLDDGVTLDRPQVDRRMAVIRQDLVVVLDRLVAATDATIFVTNYYNPTAERPQGIATCRLECFRAAADEVVGYMNDTIEEVARSYPADRVVFVDFETPFVGRGAPNGYGPDGLREGGFGVVGDVLAEQLKEVHPYCTRGPNPEVSWVNPIDCVHPDERGTQELAEIMASAILTHLGIAPAT